MFCKNVHENDNHSLSSILPTNAWSLATNPTTSPKILNKAQTEKQKKQRKATKNQIIIKMKISV